MALKPPIAYRITALVVDDSAAMRRHVRQALERLSIGTVEAGDGADAWRKLQGGATYDLILTDINMPLMDGLKLVGLVRSGGLHQETPIVVITTESAEEDRRRAENLGASAYLVKPVQVHEVIEAVRRVLGLG
jgi:two-component system chemotaxis response regulator CheY